MKKLLALSCFLPIAHTLHTNDANDQIKQYWCTTGHWNWDQVELQKKLIALAKPQFCLETGFCTGRSSVPLLVCSNIIKLISIDINLDYMREGRAFSQYLMESFPEYLVIEANSKLVLTEEFFVEHFPNGIDWATVDGDHSYKGCTHDLESIAPFLNDNGIILVDDFRGPYLPSVTRAVQDFYKKHPHFYMIKWHTANKGCAIFTRSKDLYLAIKKALS